MIHRRTSGVWCVCTGGERQALRTLCGSRRVSHLYFTRSSFCVLTHFHHTNYMIHIATRAMGRAEGTAISQNERKNTARPRALERTSGERERLRHPNELLDEKRAAHARARSRATLRRATSHSRRSRRRRPPETSQPRRERPPLAEAQRPRSRCGQARCSRAASQSWR